MGKSLWAELYPLKEIAFDCDRYRQPLWTIGSLDDVSIAPVSPGVLHIVIQDKLVGGID